MFLKSSVAIAVVVWAAAAACTSKAEAPPEPRTSLRVSRNTANDLKPAVARMPHIGLDIATEGGSSINSLIDLHQRKTDMSGALADVAYLAYNGQLEEIGAPFSELRGMAVTGLNTIHLLAGPGTKIESLRDLRGLRVSLGTPGSSVALITPRMLQAHGIHTDDIRASRVPNTEVVSLLQRGVIDAAVSAFNVPGNQVIAAMKAGARLIDIEGPQIEELRTQYPYLKGTLIPAGTYPNQSKPVRTIGVDSVLVCRADLDEETVYDVLEAYFATRPATTPPNLDRAPATPIPLHAGAARYYRQKELAR
jgi:hypothetical protein